MYGAYATSPLLFFPSLLPSSSHCSLIATAGVAIRKRIRSCPVASCVLFCAHSQARHAISFRRILRLAIQRSFGGLVIVWRLIVDWRLVVVRTDGLLVRIRWLGLAKVLPFAPAIEVDERLHAAPFHHFARKPFKVHRLRGCQYAERQGSR